MNDFVVRLALDTGATSTLINERILRFIGYDPTRSSESVLITTGSGIESARVVQIAKLAALRQERREFPLICFSLPETTAVDGLLGLDFFRGRKLSIDFRAGRVNLK
jgi:predicted aspartyl protease